MPWRAGANLAGVNPTLLALLQRAAQNSPYIVQPTSGVRAPGSDVLKNSAHHTGQATDVELIDPQTGKVIPNYQNATSAKAYQDFANQVYGSATPDQRQQLRWGGYFWNGGPGHYGNMDLMHFDYGTGQPMGAGSFEKGFAPNQVAAYKLPGSGTPAGQVMVASNAPVAPPGPAAAAAPARGPLLSALLSNESGGRNIPNTTQGTSSGQAQGYFQITTGTWKEFAQQAGIDINQYPNPMAAPYDVQAKVASTIPLKRWDPTTVALMSKTGKPIDPNKTLGENLSASGESFGSSPDLTTPVATRSSSAGGPGGGTPTGEAPSASNMAGPDPTPTYSSSPGGPGGGTRTGQAPPPLAAQPTAVAGNFPPAPAAPPQQKGWRDMLASAMAGMGKGFAALSQPGPRSDMTPQVSPSVALPAQPIIDPTVANNQRQQMAMALARLNSGQLYG